MQKTIEIIKVPSVQEQAVEIVERKGAGHPDYICDSAMEAVSVALSAEYLRTAGAVLHHNMDKCLLVAGEVIKGFGGGRVVKPMEFIVGDRAAFKADGLNLPVAKIARQSVKAWFMENLKAVDVERDLRIRVALRPGSAELADIFKRGGKRLGANDTSAAVGYAPATNTEQAVYDTERLINSPDFKKRFPETGQDVKVMGIRKGSSLDLTVACPLMAGLIRSENDYFRKKSSILKALKAFTSRFHFRKIDVNFNTLDIRGRGADGVYLSLLGTSAEDADSGQVGRGNRVNGVISLNRPTGTEAAAGKNPVSHVGKIYSVLAHMMAGRIYEALEGVKEVYVWLLSQIGSPIDDPKEIYVKVVQGRPDLDKKALRRIVSRIIDEALSGMDIFTEELSRGVHPVC